MKICKWEITPDKFLPESETLDFLSVIRIRAESSQASKTSKRDYFILYLALATGLRVMEMAALNNGDLYLRDSMPFIHVRNGKGGKERKVYITHEFKDYCLEYLGWKVRINESIEPDEPLLRSSHTGRHMTSRALQKSFKRCARIAGIPLHYSIHSTRHSYACLLLKVSNWNLRLVQKQLGHSRITTTQVYADVMLSDIEKAVGNLPL